MPRELKWVSWDDDAELSKSRKSPGSHSPLTRDREGNLGQVTLSDVDEHELASAAPGPTYRRNDDATPLGGERSLSESVFEAIAVAAGEVVVELLVETAKPHVAHWWKTKAEPALRARTTTTRDKLRGVRPGESRDGLVPADPVGQGDVEAAVEPRPDDAPVMSTVEAQQRLAAALVARAFSDEQVRAVLDAQVVDEDGRPVSLSLQEVPVEQIEKQVEALLAANPSLLPRLVELFADVTGNVAVDELPAGYPPTIE